MIWSDKELRPKRGRAKPHCLDGVDAALLAATSDGIVVFDTENRTLAANVEARRIFGVAIDASDFDTAIVERGAAWLLTLQGGSSGTVRGLDGVARRVDVRVEVLANGSRVIAMTDQSGDDGAVDGDGQRLLAWYQTILSRSTDVVCVFDRLGQLQWASRDMFGYQRGEAVGMPFMDFVHPDDVHGLVTRFGHLLVTDGATNSTQLRIRYKDDETWRHVDVVGTSHIGDEAISGLVVNIRDVTSRAEATARLEWQAFHDPLTSLPNRTLLLDRLERALPHAARAKTSVALLYVDIDRFKEVNDTFGHAVGDQVLRTVADRLRACTRDIDTVARLGGDEFVVLYDECASDAAATGVCERIVGRIREPIDTHLGRKSVTCSIGVVRVDGGQAESVLRTADEALYRAKEQGRDGWVLTGPPASTDG